MQSTARAKPSGQVDASWRFSSFEREVQLRCMLVGEVREVALVDPFDICVRSGNDPRPSRFLVFWCPYFASRFPTVDLL
jgi:hypothetical protein